jgi:hypothetical protein
MTTTKPDGRRRLSVPIDSAVSLALVLSKQVDSEVLDETIRLLLAAPDLNEEAP